MPPGRSNSTSARRPRPILPATVPPRLVTSNGLAASFSSAPLPPVPTTISLSAGRPAGAMMIERAADFALNFAAAAALATRASPSAVPRTDRVAAARTRSLSAKTIERGATPIRAWQGRVRLHGSDGDIIDLDGLGHRLPLASGPSGPVCAGPMVERPSHIARHHVDTAFARQASCFARISRGRSEPGGRPDPGVAWSQGSLGARVAWSRGRLEPAGVAAKH